MPLPMPVTDSMFLIVEGRSQPMHVGSLQIFDPPADGSFDPRALYERMLAQPTLAPLYRKRAVRGVTSAGQWAWNLEDEVELEHHIRRSALPRPGRPRELLELVGRLHSTLLDPRRPLWESHLIEGLWDGKVAIYTKVHHSVMDGVSGLKLLVRALSPDPAERGMPAPWSREALGPPEPEHSESGNPLSAALAAALGLPGQAVSAVSGAKDLLMDVAGLAPALTRVVAKGLADSAQQLPFDAPRTILNSDDISSSRRFAAQSWELPRIQAVAKAGGYTVNDVMLAMCSGAMRSWLDDLAALPDSSLVSMVPVSLQASAGGGNSVGTILCNLGTDLTTAGARIDRVHDSMTKGKAALEGLSPMQVLALSMPGMAPFALRRTLPGILQRPPFNLVISNVPGPTKPMYFDGARLEQLYPLSIPLNGQAMNITVVSNDDQLGFGIVGCRKRAPHLQRLLGHLEEELTALEQDLA